MHHQDRYRQLGGDRLCGRGVQQRGKSSTSARTHDDEIAFFLPGNACDGIKHRSIFIVEICLAMHAGRACGLLDLAKISSGSGPRLFRLPRKLPRIDFDGP